MKASDVMDPNPVTLKPSDTIEDAARYIMQKRFRSLPVVDENFCYMGMFGVNCLLKQVIPRAVMMENGLENVSFLHETFDDLHERFDEVKDQPIEICMNREVEAITPDTPLTETLLRLHDTRASIPVMEQDTCKLLGMISYWDIGKKILSAGNTSDA